MAEKKCPLPPNGINEMCCYIQVLGKGSGVEKCLALPSYSSRLQPDGSTQLACLSAFQSVGIAS
jgi:hypothetical protein